MQHAFGLPSSKAEERKNLRSFPWLDSAYLLSKRSPVREIESSVNLLCGTPSRQCHRVLDQRCRNADIPNCFSFRVVDDSSWDNSLSQ